MHTHLHEPDNRTFTSGSALPTGKIHLALSWQQGKRPETLRACVRMVRFAPRRSPMSFLGGGPRLRDALKKEVARDAFGTGKVAAAWQSHELQNEPHGNGDACTGLEASRAKPSRPKVKGSWPARAGPGDRRGPRPRGHLSAMMMPAKR